MKMIYFQHKFDLLIRDYFKNSACFCDFLNGTFFHGDQIACESQVNVCDGEYSGQLLNQEYMKRSRDHLMSVRLECSECLMAFEHQSTYDASMYQRVMEYDYLTYRRQYLDYKHSRCQKKMIGVVTFVLYYGYRRWKQPLCYRDMMKSIPKSISQYVNVNFYPLIVVDELDENKFQKKTNRELILGLKYIHGMLEDVKELYVEYEIAEILSALMKDEKILSTLKVNEKGEVEMCEYIMEMKRNERNLGRKEGEQEEKCKMLIQLLKMKFRQLSADTVRLIYESRMERLDELTIQIFEVKNEDEVKKIILKNK